jgi:hypothetical protein
MVTMDPKRSTIDNVENIKLTSQKDQGNEHYETVAIEFAARDEEWHAYRTRRLLRKVDMHLLPWIVLMYLTNFLDRTYAPTLETSLLVMRY